MASPSNIRSNGTGSAENTHHSGPSISGVDVSQTKTPPATARRHRISLEDDHEIYLQLMAGENKTVEKTANQLHLEERARLLDRRARDPAVTDPECAPGPVDFECAEERERRYGPGVKEGHGHGHVVGVGIGGGGTGIRAGGGGGGGEKRGS